MSTEVDLKANELYYKFSKLFMDANADSVHEPSKMCALFTVNEILSLKMICNMSRNDKYSESEFYELVE